MTRSSITCQLTRTLVRAAIDAPVPRTLCATTRCTRPFTSSSSHRDDPSDERKKLLANLLNDQNSSSPTISATTAPRRSESMLDLAKAMDFHKQSNMVERALGWARNTQKNVEVKHILRDDELDLSGNPGGVDNDDDMSNPEPFHFHVYSHRHNTHVTVTRPNRNPIISLSSGNLGFRHANRGHYDSAYQLGAYTIDKLQQAGWHTKIHQMEVILRGFGPGREAVTKVLLSNEGRLLRDKIVKVSDSTRLKFGGSRSKKPRRL